MQCPYCVSQIANQALVCPVCSRDLYLVKSLLERQAVLEQTIATQIQELDALASQVKTPGAPVADLNAPEQAAASEPPMLSLADRKFWKSACLSVLYAVVAIHAASWFARLIYDAPDLLLRIFTIVISVPFGYALVKRHAHRVSQAIVPGILLGVIAVAIWRALNDMLYHVPFMPANLSQWRDAIEYAVGMALAYFTGALIRQTQLLFSDAYRGKPSALMRSMAGLFRSNEKGESGSDALARNLQRAVAMITPLASGITAVYAVVKSMGGTGQ